VLFQVDVTPLFDLGAFDPTKGDTLEIRGNFNGWSDADPSNSIMRQSLTSINQYEITVPITEVPGKKIPYKFFIQYDDQGGTRAVPESGWEEPASTGGANRFYVFGDQPQQLVPMKYFDDIYIEDVIPEGDTITIKMTANMRLAFLNPDLNMNPGGKLQMDEQDPIWRFITHTPNASTDTTAMVYEDTDGDSVYTMSFDLAGPAPNWIQYRLMYNGQDEEGSDTQAAGRRRVRYIRKNADGSWPSTFQMGKDIWNSVLGRALTVEERNGGTIDDDTTALSVRMENPAMPDKFYLKQNYPNPFNPITTISYSIPKTTNVHLAIYNMLGQKVAILVNAMKSAGSYKVIWNGKDSFGRNVGSGLYIYQLEAGSLKTTKKMLLMR